MIFPYIRATLEPISKPTLPRGSPLQASERHEVPFSKGELPSCTEESRRTVVSFPLSRFLVNGAHPCLLIIRSRVVPTRQVHACGGSVCGSGGSRPGGQQIEDGSSQK